MTILAREASASTQELSELGLSVQPISLQGRYYCRSAHEDGVHSLKKLCREDTRFQLPNAVEFILPLRSNIDGNLISDGALHEIALESILLEQCHWFQTVQWAAVHTGVEPDAIIPVDRFKVPEIKREPEGLFWGNFLRNPYLYDHRFFGISGREAKYMDPQQRLVLQVAYEALESAGYFGVKSSPEYFPSDIGCYLGVGSVDYSDNIASHDATAFSALGMLQAFICGRISQYFGWSRPSITYDTACLSGAVAIHAAVNVCIHMCPFPPLPSSKGFSPPL